MDEREYPVNKDKDEDVQFYLEEMQRMNNQMIDMQRELNRALRESKKMQEELKKNAELKIALEASERAGKAKMDFMSRMSHDMRTPMNVIMGLTAATVDEADDPKSVRENMANIRAASDFMLGLINDILDMGKIEKDAVVLNYGPYSYREFALEMRTMFQGQCDAKNITLYAKEADTNPVVMADKIRLKQIFFNIVSNSIKYTQPGGSIEVGAYHVKKNEADNTISAEYRITDTGIGMSEEFQKHLFEPFVQEDNSFSSQLQGSGLGLSITKRLVEQMGGSIYVKSEKGKGTTIGVTLTFELARQQESRSQIKAKKDVYDILHGKSILLVEDHPLNAQIARRLLEKQQMHVISAENGRAALELFQSSPVGSFNAVLMDIRMPEMSGLEAAKAIRTLNRADAKKIPIIAMSANAYTEDVQQSIEAGMNDHLAKPVNSEILYETLSRYLLF